MCCTPAIGGTPHVIRAFWVIHAVASTAKAHRPLSSIYLNQSCMCKVQFYFKSSGAEEQLIRRAYTPDDNQSTEVFLGTNVWGSRLPAMWSIRPHAG
jgi:hypothetical protein